MLVYKIYKTENCSRVFTGVAFEDEETAKTLLTVLPTNYMMAEKIAALNAEQFIMAAQMPDEDLFKLINAFCKEYNHKHKKLIALVNSLMKQDIKAVKEFLVENPMDLGQDMISALFVTLNGYLLNRGVDIERFISVDESYTRWSPNRPVNDMLHHPKFYGYIVDYDNEFGVDLAYERKTLETLEKQVGVDRVRTGKQYELSYRMVDAWSKADGDPILKDALFSLIPKIHRKGIIKSQFKSLISEKRYKFIFGKAAN